MCLSAEASFGISAVLLPAGVYCISIATKKNTAYIPLSLLPAIFSVQQFGEGLVWFGLDRGEPALVKMASLVYLFFAFLFWLFWIPFSLLFIETRRKVRLYLGAVALLGLAVGAMSYLPVALDAERRLKVGIVHHSIRYDSAGVAAFQNFPRELGQLLYVAIVLCPLIVSSHRALRVFAVNLAVSATVAHFVFWYAYESVWCFFAAVLSVQLCCILRKLPEAVDRREVVGGLTTCRCTSPS